MPAGTRQYFLPKLSFADVKRAIESKHQAIVPMFFSGVGMKVMFVESEILIAVLLQLLERSIVALPVHDAIIVRQDRAPVAMSVMKAVFKEHTGVPAALSCDPDPREQRRRRKKVVLA